MQRLRRQVLAGWCVLGLTVTLVGAQTAVAPAQPTLEGVSQLLISWRTALPHASH
jgi:hypothetical protein